MTTIDPASAGSRDGSRIFHIFRNDDGFRVVVERGNADEAAALAQARFADYGKSDNIEPIATHNINHWSGETPFATPDYEPLGITENMAIEAARLAFNDDDHVVDYDALIRSFWVGSFWLNPAMALDHLADSVPVLEERMAPDTFEARRRLKALLDELAEEPNLSPRTKQAIRIAAPYAEI